jgi:hypothetical protein
MVIEGGGKYEILAFTAMSLDDDSVPALATASVELWPMGDYYHSKDMFSPN